MLDLFVWDAISDGKIPAIVEAATEQDLTVTTELVEYYSKEFGAIAPMRYDPFRMLILEEAAERLVSDYM